MIDAAQCVVIGSGSLGASVAFHLAARGSQVVLLDKHDLGSQTSPRAAGLTSQARETELMTAPSCSIAEPTRMGTVIARPPAR